MRTLLVSTAMRTLLVSNAMRTLLVSTAKRTVLVSDAYYCVCYCEHTCGLVTGFHSDPQTIAPIICFNNRLL